MSKPSQLKPHFQVPIPHWALFVLDWILDSCVRVRLTQPDLTCSSFHPLFPGICICSSSFNFLNPTSQQILPIMSSETKETGESPPGKSVTKRYSAQLAVPSHPIPSIKISELLCSSAVHWAVTSEAYDCCCPSLLLTAPPPQQHYCECPRHQYPAMASHGHTNFVALSSIVLT